MITLGTYRAGGFSFNVKYFFMKACMKFLIIWNIFKILPKENKKKLLRAFKNRNDEFTR